MIQVIIYSLPIYGPLWCRDEDGNYHQGATKTINSDPTIRELCKKMEEISSNLKDAKYYAEGKRNRKDDKEIEEIAEKMFPLIEEMKQRLNHLNDGSYEIEDWETYRINGQMIHKKKIVRTGKAHLELWDDYGAVPPIWDRYDTYDNQEEIPDNVWEDETILELGDKMDNIYWSFLDYSRFNRSFEKNEKAAMPEMLDLYKKFRRRLVELNDGSYDIIDIYPIELLTMYGDAKKYWFLKKQKEDDLQAIIIYSQYKNGPLWYRDKKGSYHRGATERIDNDSIIRDLVRKITEEFDMCSENVEILDDEGKNKALRECQERHADAIFPLLTKLKERLNQLNDGSYEIEDWETHQLNDYYQINKNKRVKTGKAHLELYSFFSYDTPIYPTFDVDEDEDNYNLSFVFEDEIVNGITDKINHLYGTYETKRAMDKECVFFKNEKKGMKEMIELYKQLRERLVEINDGSYDIIDEYPLYLLCHYGDVKNIKY